jgi:hypothetical protein
MLDRPAAQTQDRAPAPAQNQAPAPAPAPADDRAESQGTSRAQTQDQARDQVRRQHSPSAALSRSSRYSFKRVDGGFLRLDNQSGHIAFCGPHAVGWACQAVPEDRAALEKEIARLRDEVTRLTQEIATLRGPSPPPRPPADMTPRSDKGGGLPLPSDQDIARARAAVAHAWRQLMDMLANVQKDMMRKAQPDRTTL